MPVTHLTERRREQLRLASARHYKKHRPKSAPYDPAKYQRDKAQYKLAQAKYYQSHKVEIKARRAERKQRRCQLLEYEKTSATSQQAMSHFKTNA